MSNLAHIIDKSYSLKCNSKNLFYNIPNYPTILIRKEISLIQKKLKTNNFLNNLIRILKEE